MTATALPDGSACSGGGDESGHEELDTADDVLDDDVGVAGCWRARGGTEEVAGVVGLFSDCRLLMMLADTLLTPLLLEPGAEEP